MTQDQRSDGERTAAGVAANIEAHKTEIETMIDIVLADRVALYQASFGDSFANLSADEQARLLDNPVALAEFFADQVNLEPDVPSDLPAGADRAALARMRLAAAKLDIFLALLRKAAGMAAEAAVALATAG